MGQSKSKTRVTVQVYNQGIFPGDILTGKVCIEVPVHEVVDDEAMELRLLGWEQTSSIESKLGGLSRRMIHEVNQFLDISYGILSFQPGKTMSSGKHEFPFQIPLHPGLKPNIVSIDPGSTGGACKIGYRLEVRVRGPKTGGVLVRVFSKGLKITGAPLVQFPLFSTPTMAPLLPVKAVFVEGGWIAFAASLSAGAVQIGQEFKVAYSVQNYSAASIESLTISLLEKIEWKGRKSTRCIYRNSIGAVRVGSGATSNLREINSVNIHHNEISDERFLHKMKTELDTANPSVSISITPKTAREDFNNIDITVSHEITLYLKASKGVKSEIKIPVIIYAERVSVEKSIVPSSPPGWYPTFIGPEAIYGLCGYKAPRSYQGIRPVVDIVDPHFPKPFHWKEEDSFAVFWSHIESSPIMYSYSYEFRKWLDVTATMGQVDTIAPEEIHALLAKTKQRPVEHLEVIELYLARRSSLPCDQIYQMILACIPTYRLHIVEAAAWKCPDRENREILQTVFSRFEYFCVNQYFGQDNASTIIGRPAVYTMSNTVTVATPPSVSTAEVVWMDSRIPPTAGGYGGGYPAGSVASSEPIYVSIPEGEYQPPAPFNMSTDNYAPVYAVAIEE